MLMKIITRKHVIWNTCLTRWCNSCSKQFSYYILWLFIKFRQL